MEAKMIVRAEGFCTACQRRLFVRTHDAQWVMPVIAFENIRSGCCNAYVSHVIQPVPAEDCFLGHAYTQVSPREPPTSYALAVPSDAAPRAPKAKGRK